MKAAAIDRYGGPEVIHAEQLPVPEPRAPEGVSARAYDGVPDADAFNRLNALIAEGPFHVEVRFYAMEDAPQAHRDVEKHRLGKLALRMH